MDDLDQLIQLVALPTCESNELLRALGDGAAFGRPCNRDSAPAPELEQSLVSEEPQRTQHGVRVDTKDRGEILRRRQTLPGLRLAARDRTANPTGDLPEQIHRDASVDLDSQPGHSQLE